MNMMQHIYGDIKYELLWNVATKHIPMLMKQLQSLMPSIPKK